MGSYRLFVYGTLKRGQPNFEQMGSKYGVAKYIGQARTVKKWPLVIASSCNIPYLLDREGTGHHITGEIYEVDDRMLQHCDEFECCPDYFKRTTIQVQLTEDSTGSKVEGNPEDVYVYILAGYKDFMLELPSYESYDSQGSHSLPFSERYKQVSKSANHKQEVLK